MELYKIVKEVVLKIFIKDFIIEMKKQKILHLM